MAAAPPKRHLVAVTRKASEFRLLVFYTLWVQVWNIGNFETAFGSDRPDRDGLMGSLGDDTDACSVLEMTGGVSVHGPDIQDGGRHYQKHQR